jgi:DNA-binding MarR family transcriptional regulator
MRPSEETIEAWRRLLQVHQRLTVEMDAELRRDHDLRLDWYDVLFQLSVGGGRMRMYQLADATLFSRTDCTRIVDRMAGEGLVRRERADDDARGVYAVLTSEGRALLRRAARTHLEGIQRLFGTHMTSEEAEAMAATLGTVLEGAGE